MLPSRENLVRSNHDREGLPRRWGFCHPAVRENVTCSPQEADGDPANQRCVS